MTRRQYRLALTSLAVVVIAVCLTQLVVAAWTGT